MPRFEIHDERDPEFNALSPLEQQGIYDLERSHIDGYNAKLILASYLGFKSSLVEVSDSDGQDIETHENEIENIFRLLGLQFIKQRMFFDEDSPEVKEEAWYLPGYRTDYIIGKQKIPDFARKYIGKTRGNGPVDHREFGTLMGIPQAAIEEFVSGSREGFLPSSMPADIPEAKFLWFTPSEDHWQEEIRPVTELANKVKKISPTMYGRIMRSV